MPKFEDLSLQRIVLGETFKCLEASANEIYLVLFITNLIRFRRDSLLIILRILLDKTFLPSNRFAAASNAKLYRFFLIVKSLRYVSSIVFASSAVSQVCRVFLE